MSGPIDRRVEIVLSDGTPVDSLNPLPTTGGGGGGGGGAVTMAAGAVAAGAYVVGSLVDGAIATLGLIADAAVTGDANGTANAHLRGITKIAADVWDSVNHRLVVDGSHVTQPVSAVSLPLPAGAAQDRTTAAAPSSVELSDGASFYVGAKTGQLPAALVGGRLDVNLGAAPAALTIGTLPSIPTGSNVIGAVTQSGGPWSVSVSGALPTGANTIGAVTAPGGGALALDATLTSRFPAAAALADGTANPTLTQIQTFPVVYNGTTWDRWKDMAAAQAQTTFTGIPAVAPFYLDTTGTPSTRRAVTAASTTGGVSGTQVPSGSMTVYDGTNFQAWRQVTSATGTTGAGISASGNMLWDLVGTTNFVKQAGDGSGRSMVVGAAAAGSAVTGNPVLVGVSDGTNVQTCKQSPGWAATANTGVPIVVAGVISGSSNVFPLTDVARTNTDNQTSGVLTVAPYLSNGSGVDRQRNNVDVTLLSSAARTTTQTSSDITVYNAHSIIVTLDVTAITSTVSLTVGVNYKDPASGKYISLFGTPPATVTGVSTNMYKINPNFASAAGVGQNDLGRVIQIVVTVGNANSQTYSVGYTLIG